MEENVDKIKFSEVSAALQDQSRPFPPRLLRGFSDLSPKDVKEFAEIWKDLPILRKQSLLEDLEDLAEKDTLVCFDEMAMSVLDDAEAAVRVLAIRLLWECEDAHIVPDLIELMLGDTDEAVRSTAASMLGRFVYLGELDEIPDAAKISVVKNLLDVVNSEELASVRLRALESLGYSSHATVPLLLRTAYESGDSQWVASALCAMGRSADDQWSDHVQEKLDSDDTEVLFEAIRAAGELELTDTLDRLFTILEEGYENDIRLAAIWSLSQIGGNEVKNKLRELAQESESDEELEWIEKALDNLELNSSSGDFNFFNFKPESEEYDNNEDDYSEDEDLDDDGFDSLDDYDEDDEDDEE